MSPTPRLRFHAVVILAAFALAACQAAQTPGSQSPGSPTLSSDASMAPTPQGELRVAHNQFPVSLDSAVGGTGYTLTSYGVAESLMRLTPDMKVEPWIAESAQQDDPLVTKVTIRGNVTFWDGTAVDAVAVKASLERSMAESPSVASLLPEGTKIDAEGQDLTITTPEPVGTMLANLAAFNLVIQKVASDGEFLYTGPFTYSDFVEQQSVTLNAYEEHRTPPRIKTIRVTRVTDTSARVLALQSGDVDLAFGLLPSQVAQLEGGAFTVHNFPFGSQDVMVLNVTRAPLDEVAVRQAVSLAIDREALVAGVMDGAARPAYALAPDDIGLLGVVNTQEFDQDEAIRILDAAGWVAGPDGMRSKDGRPLAFTITYYAQRAELEPLATFMKDQLAAVGIAVTLENVPDISAVVASSDFDATMYQYGVAVYGTLVRPLTTFFTPSGTNTDRYSNDELNDLFAEYAGTIEPAQQEALLAQIQELIREDVPVVYILNPNQIVASSTRVTGYAPHPLEIYQISPDLAIQ